MGLEHDPAGAMKRLRSKRVGSVHYGRIESLPPYIGGDDDEIDAYRAICDCGWKDEKTWADSVTALDHLVKHLNDEFVQQWARGWKD